MKRTNRNIRCFSQFVGGDDMNKNKIYMYIGLFILLVSTVGSIGTYAWFTWSSTNNTSVTLSIGELADVTYITGPDIKVNNLSPVYNYTDGVYTTFNITNRDTTSNLLYTVKLNLTSESIRDF